MKSLRNRSNSIFGKCPEIYKKRVSHWKNRKEFDKYDFLVIDDRDGRLGMCPLRSGAKVTIYEPNSIYLYGGKINTPIRNLESNEIIYKPKTSLGLEDRINLEFLEGNVNLHNENFYESEINHKYGYVATSKSLDREENKLIPMADKINKLKDAVESGGYLYVEYYIALDSDDYNLYPQNQYLRYGEMKNYFSDENWTILSIEEYPTTEDITKMNLESKKIIFGKIDVRKKGEHVKRKPRKINNIRAIKNPRNKKVRNYIINGVLR